MQNHLRVKIKDSRELNNYSISDFSKLLNISPDELTRIENGQLVPDRDTLIHIGTLLGLDLINDDVSKNIKIFDILKTFYDLQMEFRNFQNSCKSSKAYNDLLNSCIYKDGLIYPKMLDEIDLNLSNIELLFFKECLEVLRLKIRLGMKGDMDE